jgi:hypothetical protein
LLVATTLCVAFSLVGSAYGQTHTENFTNIGTGPGSTGFTGTLGGNIAATLDPVGTGGALNITDLDLAWTKGPSGFLTINVFPSSGSSNNNTAVAPIVFTSPGVNINIPTTGFASSVNGALSVTAGDNTANAVVGVLDGGVPGSDGKWDDPTQTGILNNAQANSFNVALDNPINAAANVTGSLGAAFPNDVVIPNVITGTFDVDLVIKNSSNVNLNFSPVQNISLQNLTISSAVPIPLDIALAGNFVDGAHPVPGANATLDLSAGGLNVVATTISGNLVADLMGTITGSIDLRADISVLGLFTIPVNFDNVIDGDIGGGTISLFELNEAISLADQELPFAITVLHQADANVDFDDVIASLASGTLGLTVPIDLSQENVLLAIPPTSFEIGNQITPGAYNFPVSGTGYNGTIHLQHLAASLTGNVVLDLDASFELGADLLATALGESLINVVPEPGSMSLMAFAGLGLAGYFVRHRRRKA